MSRITPEPTGDALMSRYVDGISGEVRVLFDISLIDSDAYSVGVQATDICIAFGESCSRLEPTDEA